MDVILHPSHFKLVLRMLRFCKMREEDVYKIYRMEQQIEHIANQFSLRSEDFKRYIDVRMFQEPPRYIQIFRYADVITFIAECKFRGKAVVIYSDYPAKEKLKVFHVQCDLIFYPGHDIANEMKPSIKAIKTIIDSLPVSDDKILYVGDRYDTDGVSAVRGGIKYIDFKRLRKILNKKESRKYISCF